MALNRFFLRITRWFKSGQPEKRLSQKAHPGKPELVPSSESDFDSHYYDATFERGKHWRKHYRAVPHYAIWRVIADGMRRDGVRSVLDLGCGTGQFACLLHDEGFPQYIGIDFSHKRIEWARQVCPHFTFTVADVFETGLLESLDYDSVVCTEFLEHIEDDLALLQRIRSGTRVYASVPNFSNRAHVRYFANKDEVTVRYSPLFAEFNVTSRPNRKRKEFYIFDSLKK